MYVNASIAISLQVSPYALAAHSLEVLTRNSYEESLSGWQRQECATD